MARHGRYTNHSSHAYFHIDQDIIGHVVNRDIPVLRNQLVAIAEALGNEV